MAARKNQPKAAAAPSPEAAQRLVHDLHVHQVELETQNEELRRAQAELEASRARYFDLYDLAPVGYITVSETGLILEANLTAANLLGVARGALVKQPLTRFIVKEDQDLQYLHCKQLFAGGTPQACELRMLRSLQDSPVHTQDGSRGRSPSKRGAGARQEALPKQDATPFWARLDATAVQDAQGTRVCRVVIHDITARKFQDEERDLTARLIVLANTPDGFPERLSALTACLQAWSGCEAVGIRLQAGDDYPYYETRGFPSGFVEKEDHLCARGPNGEILHDGKGDPVLECMCGNILRGRFDPAQPFFTAHGSFWTNSTTALLASTTDADRHARVRNRCPAEGYESVALIPLRARQQTFGLLQFNDRQPNRFTPERIAHFERLADSLAIALAQRQAEDTLRESEERHRVLFEASHDALMTLAPPAWNFTACNPATVAMFKVRDEADFTARAPWELSPETQPDGRASAEKAGAMIEAAMREGAHFFKWTHRRTDGETFPAEVLLTRVKQQGHTYLQATVRDITARERFEARLRQSEKLEAIGQLAGGVAHDFNNQLTAVIGYAEMLCARLDEPNLKRYAEIVHTAAQRAADLTADLLAFAREGQYESVPVDLHQVILETAEMLQRSIDKRIEIELRLHAPAAVVTGDPTQLQNALLNLGLNARDAMPDGGTLTFETRIAPLDTLFCARHPGVLQPGDHLLLTVTDTGHGMSDAVKRHLFEPFFTTKPVGKGTGMGLAAVHGTVGKHQGAIDVSSEVGHGTCFKIYLPLAKTPALPAAPDRTAAAAPLVKLRILVVDDEELVCALASEVLQEAGHTVTTAADGNQALEIYRRHWQDIDLVLLDMMMPKLSGSETFRAMKAINPGVRVILSSGFSLDGDAQAVLSDGALGFVAKPYRRGELLAAIAQVTQRQG
ncbi:MAG: hypothetical protein A3K19_04750 [Lentisphaerae bacterium RIFOXYB12_FULL_65_16]|nr:MAG: hypothetical protein A3K18_11490 [Lentisphaerae bacterium RIFOXYA12_64_32]OGV84040.1 MAG: hypothetical protein A3K19_04750 [Lentisphaerae bacterium RIFOXYB12_FULL_65_16]